MLGILKKVFIFSVILKQFSCVTSNSSKPDSKWQELNRSGSISCRNWPLKESELDITNIISTAEGNGGIVASIRQRNGSNIPVYVQTNGSESIDVEDLKSFPVGRDAHVIAISQWNNEPIAFVVQNKNERAWLEIRAISDNRMISRMATPFPDEVSSGRLVQVQNGWWLQLNHGEGESSFAFMNVVSSNWTFSLSTYQSHTRFSSFAGSSRDQSAYIVEQLNSDVDGQSKFSIHSLQPNGKSKDFGIISLKTSGGLESWTAGIVNNRLILAIVRGDSMIGQASLVVSGFTLTASGISQNWTKEFNFPDVHLGEPVWLSNGKTALIGLMRWIDGESSLSRVRLDDEKADLLQDVGIFPKGTVLTTGYLTIKQVGLAGFRFRENDLWKYKICKIAI